MCSKGMSVSTAVYFTMGAQAQLLQGRQPNAFSRKNGPPPILDAQKKEAGEGKAHAGKKPDAPPAAQNMGFRRAEWSECMLW